MTLSKLTMSVLLLALFSALSTGVSVYTQVRAAMALEGGNLRSVSAVQISQADSHLVTTLGDHAVDGRLFQELDDSGRVRAMRTLGEAAPLPIHDGRQIRVGESRVALVGAQVKTHGNGADERYVDFAGRAYRVVGWLGVHQSSVLSHEVLLQDADLITEDSAVVADVPHGAAGIPGLSAERAQTLGSQTDQRTNIDFVSPIVITCGWVLSIVGALSSGLLIARSSWRLMALRYRLGQRRLSVFLEAVIPLAAVSVVVFAVSAGLGLVTAGALRSVPMTVPAAGIPVLVTAAGAASALAWSLWGGNRRWAL